LKKQAVRVLLNLDIIIACAALAALIVFTFAAVVMRYFVGRPIAWGEEYQLMSMVIIVFFAAGAGFRFKSHVAIDIVVDKMPQKAQKVIGFVIYALTVLILLYFFIHSVMYVRQMFETARVTNLLRIPYGLIYASFPLSCALMILHYTLQTFRKGPRTAGEEAQ